MAHWIEKLNLIETPSYLIDKRLMDKNLNIISHIKAQTNCNIILALKAFSTFSVSNLFKHIIDGVTASSIYEARLGVEEFNGNIHVHTIGMDQNDIKQYQQLASHISFNSINQMESFKKVKSDKTPSLGLRINPQISSVKTEKYNPCAQYSRLGIPIQQINPGILEEINGLHFHALCEQGIEPLLKCLEKIENKFGDNLKHCDWINWGGGHLLTSDNYELDKLIYIINEWQKKYECKIILEPGEAFSINSGYYVSKILDIIENEKNIIICDISATAHMPDILEYPYRPRIKFSAHPNQKKHTYIIGGNTCLAGDIIGEYSFDQELKINDHLIFEDMAHYTIVKTSNFNGVKQPSIGIINEVGKINMIRHSSYFNFKERLS